MSDDTLCLILRRLEGIDHRLDGVGHRFDNVEREQTRIRTDLLGLIERVQKCRRSRT